MARPKSEEKRSAILESATRVIARQGLGAPTATIAKEAGISNGSLFNYFETKADLLNQLYLELKADMATAAMREFPTGAGLSEQLFQVWSNWMAWAVASPEKRRVLEQLRVSDEITLETRTIAQKTASSFLSLIAQVHKNGPLQSVSLEFTAALMNALAEATVDAMLKNPTSAKKHCRLGFDAFWRAVT